MTTRERFQRMYQHREADRVPLMGAPWSTTIARWRREGMPEGVGFVDYFGLDHTVNVGGDISPRYESRVEKIEEEIHRLLPLLKENGGYLFQEDHSIPDSVSLENYRRIVQVARELGSYS